jgi:Cu-processing system ATP-binding protein
MGAMRAETPIIALDAVAKRYGTVEAVRGISLALEPGERIALVGHNGAGKTTLMKMMLGMARPTAGRVLVLGTDPVEAAAATRRRIGWLPENIAFSPALTGRELLRFFARLKGEPAAAADAMLERVGLAAAARRRVGTWSKGMRQRLGLAQALLGAPRAVLLDEPTTGLDPEVRQGLYDILAELAGAGTTVLLSSHALEELEGRVERVVILDRGRLVADGTLAELRGLAHLPLRLRLTLAEPGASPPEWLPAGVLRIGARLLELPCAPAEKMALLRQAAADPRIADIEVQAPTLDALYAHFLRGEARAEGRA